VLLVGNHSSFLPLLLACLRLRLVVLPLDGDSPVPEALRVAARCEAQALVALAAVPSPGGAGEPVALPCGLFCQRLSPAAATVDYQDVALLKLTSGSSDAPKGVLCTENNLFHDGEQIVEAMGIAPGGMQLAAIPLAHSYGLGNLVLPLLVHGVPFTLRHGFIPPSFCRDIESCGVTVFPGVPFMFDRMIGAMGLERLPPPLAKLITAGAPIAPATVHEFKRRFGVKIHSFYGSSETGGIAYDASEDVADPLTVGMPMPHVGVSLMPLDGADGKGGRVVVESKAVGRGYTGGSPDESAGTLAGGRFLTADLGRFDEAGRLYLVGRISRTVNVAGRKVQPEEVERVLLEIPQVKEAAVFGLPDATRGERLVSCLAASPDLTPIDVRRHCARLLSPHKIPRAIIILEQLPRTARGKIDRKALEGLAADYS
jgi:long-chain acyl-CoA synthetase